MTNEHFNKLREAAWRRKLTASEESELRAWLEAHPEAQADWQGEIALNEQLERLADVPVSNNFTSRVLQAVERETVDRTRAGRNWGWSWQRFLPRAALAAVALGLSVVLYEQHLTSQRAELARNVAGLSQVAAASDPVVLQDFDVIRSLGDSTGPDRDLLALFQ